jgi:hypothetical protein
LLLPRAALSARSKFTVEESLKKGAESWQALWFCGEARR